MDAGGDSDEENGQRPHEDDDEGCDYRRKGESPDDIEERMNGDGLA